jgi:hypothetical protein
MEADDRVTYDAFVRLLAAMSLSVVSSGAIASTEGG